MDDFMLQIKSYELEYVRFQIDEIQQNSSSQIVMMSKLPQNRTDKYLPYAFTEQGVATLSGGFKFRKSSKNEYCCYLRAKYVNDLYVEQYRPCNSCNKR